MNLSKTQNLLAQFVRSSSEAKKEISYTVSNQDSAEMFADEQAAWNEFSKSVITDIATSDNSHFKACFYELANIRKAIAEKLQQYNPQTKENKFGSFREENSDTFNMECFFPSESGPWKTQGILVNQKVTELFELEQKIISKNVKPAKNNHYDLAVLAHIAECVLYDYCDYESINNRILATSWYIQVPYGQGETRTKISRISCAKNSFASFVLLSYDPVKKSNFEKMYIHLDHHWQKLNQWTSHDGIEAFLRTAGKIAYILTHTMPLNRGTSSIIDWMIRGQAEKHDIMLGQYHNKSDTLCWPLMALINAAMDLDQYAQWYKDNAFLNPTLESSIKLNSLPMRDAPTPPCDNILSQSASIGNVSTTTVTVKHEEALNHTKNTATL